MVMVAVVVAALGCNIGLAWYAEGTLDLLSRGWVEAVHVLGVVVGMAPD